MTNRVDPLDFRRIFADLGVLHDAIVRIYEGDRRRVKSAMLLDFRCNPKGCTMLAAWRSADLGIVYYQPPYTLSPTVNSEGSNESGRAKNTLDGDRRWKARASSLDQLRSWDNSAGLHLNCDHRQIFISAPDLIAAADAAKPGQPTRRFL